MTTDGSGKIDQVIPPTTKGGILVIQDDQTPFNNIQIPLLIGSLDPVEKSPASRAG